jgi:hypothetical protein
MMDTKDSFLTTLFEKERQLDKQLEALRTTISIFQNGHPVSVSGDYVEVEKVNEVPKTYEDANTWKEKILFALGKIQSGFVQDIVDELLKYSKNESSEVLFKRITQYCSTLKKKKVLGAKTVGNKFKYFIK